MGIEKIQSFLEGQWLSGEGEGSTLIDPTTEEVVATASTKGLAMDAALNFARAKGGPALRRMTFAERGALLQRMSTALHSKREALIESAIVNGGCTRGDAKFDVDGAILVLAHYAQLGADLGDRTFLADGDGIQLGRSPRFWGQHVRVPRAGVAVLINAFNFPAWGFAEKAATALLAGMPVVTKPATATALTAYFASRALIEDADLPEGSFSFLGGGAGDLIDHMQEQDVLSFTGGASTARMLRSNENVVAKSVTVNVEADSLNAAVMGPKVDSDSETWDLMLREIAREMTQKTGQKCTAIRRIMVPESQVDEFREALGERLDDIKIGNPHIREARMGPLATKRQLEDAHAGLKELQKDAEIVHGNPNERPELVGDVPEGKGFFIDKVVLQAKNSAEADNVHSLEVFAPSVTILPYSGEAEDAASLVRKGAGTLVSSVYSDDRKFVDKAFTEIAPYTGRLYLGSAKVAEYAMGSGLVLPECVHGGPGRAGGGEELGGLRGVQHFMQRLAVQGSRPMVEKLTDTKPKS